MLCKKPGARTPPAYPASSPDVIIGPKTKLPGFLYRNGVSSNHSPTLLRSRVSPHAQHQLAWSIAQPRLLGQTLHAPVVFINDLGAPKLLCGLAQLLLQLVAVSAFGVFVIDEFRKITQHRPSTFVRSI